MNMEFLLSSLKVVDGIGDKSLLTYKRLLNLDNPRVIDLLFHRPYKILQKINQPDLKQVKDGDLIISEVIVNNVEKSSVKKLPTKIICQNETGFITLIYFNCPDFILKNYTEGKKLIISGVAKKNDFNGELIITHPDIVKNTNEIEQVYPLTFALTNRMLINTIQKILEKMKDVVLFETDEKKFGLKQCLMQMHNPKTEQELLDSPYLDRLGLYELLSQQIALKNIRNKTKNTNKIAFKRSDVLKKEYLKQIPFELTGAQKKAITDIENDIYSNTNMLRLLQGDVGSGKTIVAFLTMLPFLENKKQVAFMCPTSILAEQHYKMLKNYGVNAELLVGGKSKAKKQMLEKIKNGLIDVVVGTHAIFQDSVEFYDLGYVIIDEQHKFGVAQRLKLIEKINGKMKDDEVINSPDCLIMSATPIPRTLSLSIYGDMDISIIDEKPKNRKDIITTPIHKDKIDEVIGRIAIKIGEGEQVYWVCPLIEENEELEHLMPVKTRFEYLQKIFKEKVALLHGQMKEEEKQAVINDFASGNVKILISTIVIEVGIDVPQATIMVIENPERFGLAQIHQLRGRIGRGDLQSYCILLWERMSANFKERMEVLKDTCDGFKIAEADLKMRGAGEVLGKRQSGYAEMKFGDITNYMLVLESSNLLNKIKNYDNLLKIFCGENIENKNILN
ncbi:MAG: ATP-dependent DNA helicase RecG [Rickettsiales bacterium]|nr:MAG: ATP-dependent DNA helicase RecG [Rickettsiales bacterium]